MSADVCANTKTIARDDLDRFDASGHDKSSLLLSRWISVHSGYVEQNHPMQFNVRCLGGAVLEEGDVVDLVMRFDSRTYEWSNDIAPMRIARSGSVAIVLRRKIYVCGTIAFR